MPSIAQRANELERRFLNAAPKGNRPKIEKVLGIYRERKNVPFLTVQNMVMQLYSPSVLGPKGKEKADNRFQEFLGKFEDAKAYPESDVRTMRYIDRLKERKDRISGTTRSYQVSVLLFTQARRFDYTKEGEGRDKTRNKKFRGFAQFWKGDLTVQVPPIYEDLFEKQKWKLTERGGRDFRRLYTIFMTDQHFANREKTAPGYLDAIYIKDYTNLNRKRGAEGGANPAATRKRASGEKVAIQFRYCTTTLDLSKKTFREALQRGNHHQSECWINTLYDNYEKTLLRPEKTKNKITRETILEVLGRTEEDIKDGLTIEEVLPFFQKYKLKLRVFDIFYNCIYKYDPEVPNFNNRPFFCVAEGDHIYTINRDLESLAQKADAEEEYKVAASPNFHLPDKPEEKSDFRVLGHIDELLEILRESGENEEEKEKVIHLVQKNDNLEAVVWQLWEAGFRPSVKYMTGRLTWVSLTVNRYTFVVRSQQIIDYAIDGMMEVEDAGVYNRMHDAKLDFYHQLFKAEHRSFYSPQDLKILDDCRTVANVGWIKSLKAQRISRYDPQFMLRERDLVEIDITKAFTGAFMRITAVPVFNEFDLWQPYLEGEALRNLSLYIVESSEFDLFLNQRHNLVYGHFLKQLPQKPTIKAVKHPSMIKKVNYKALVEELWKTHISDDPEEDQVLKKTIANCNFGMLEKQFNRTQKSKLFDTYEDAKFFQTKYGGDITFIKQYEETKEWKVDPLDKGVKGAEVKYSCEMKPTGRALFVLNLFAEASLNNGFRYIKELLMQHHNFYLERSYRLLKQEGIEAYSVKTDALTIPGHLVEKASEVLNWESGIGSWRLNRKEEIKFPNRDLVLALKENSLPEIAVPTTQPIELTIEDEYNTDKLCEYFEQHRRVMVRAEFAGCGKSYACKQMEKRGHKVLFVCPTNKLCDNYGEHGCTINKFFGIGLTDDSKMARFDDSPYDTIVFDEIFFSSVRKLARIKRYCEENPEKIVIATGDTNQLESIDCITNQHDYDVYYNRCIDLIFPAGMYLRENKRLKDPQDRELLKRLKDEIFDEHIPVETTIRKYFRMVREFSTLYNIAYKNSTCQRVSDEVRYRIQQKWNAYEVGEVLVCRSWFKVKKVVFHVNYEYTITKVEGDLIGLSNGSELPESLVKKNFIHNYCRTCHSFQGSSIDNPITVFDWRFVHVSRKWLYTAITRATDLKKVQFFDYDENKESEEQMYQYFQRKVERYKQQDRKAKRKIDDHTYITKDTLISWIGKSCNSCGDCLVYSRFNGKIDCNLTAQRVSNSDSHTVENVIPYCVYCNTSMGNRE